MRPEFLIQTILKTMADTVVPAVDSNNKLASEQAQLVIAMLGIIQQRLPLMYRFDRDELSRSIELSEALLHHGEDVPAAASALQKLASCTKNSRDTLRLAQIDPNDLKAANFALREKVSELVNTLYSESKTSDLKQINDLITNHAREQLLRDRAFLASQGWEADPDAIPPLDTLLTDPSSAKTEPRAK
ncbi:hypothetical protein EHM94_17895 [Marinobacter sp. NP-6]|uniref:hypothetical protein n=1 Tax=Marinobacter sp. NP-6 TaxID=2488666 RepID=UPI000FCC6108|nr:hypothetical protein [Marinobacter sp. NP-6]RUT76906.1 hypothetical protein EHM94_17895 [Marinobacter sp. NP-6]